jgi:hypothetical protein
MIIEGIVTSVDSAGCLNIAPMGPVVEGDFERLLLRPFQPSTTFSNLQATRCGVFHVVDSVDVIARAAIGRLDVMPPTEPAEQIPGAVLKDCCRWFEFQVESVDASQPRSLMPSRILCSGERRPFRGFNRARHAIIEAAIMATRIHLLPASEIQQSLEWLRSAVEKTGDQPEQELFEMLCRYALNQDGRSV